MSTKVISAGNIGEIVSGDTTHFVFNTVSTDGEPSTLLGGSILARNLLSGAVSGVGLNLDLDYNATGSHRVQVDTSDQSAWPKLQDFSIELTGGLVGGSSVAGLSVGQLTVSGKSAGRLYEQAVKVYRGTVTSVDGASPARTFTATVTGIPNTSDMLIGQVCTFQPKTDGTASQNQGVGRAVLTTATAGVDSVTITAQDAWPNPIAIGDEFVILPEERELAIYTANITTEWGFGQSAADKYSIQFFRDGDASKADPNTLTTFTASRFRVWQWTTDNLLIDVSWPGSLSVGANTGIFKYSEPTNIITPNEGAIMKAEATIDGKLYSFDRTLFNYV